MEEVLTYLKSFLSKAELALVVLLTLPLMDMLAGDSILNLLHETSGLMYFLYLRMLEERFPL